MLVQCSSHCCAFGHSGSPICILFMCVCTRALFVCIVCVAESQFRNMYEVENNKKKLSEANNTWQYIFCTQCTMQRTTQSNDKMKKNKIGRNHTIATTMTGVNEQKNRKDHAKIYNGDLVLLMPDEIILRLRAYQMTRGDDKRHIHTQYRSKQLTPIGVQIHFLRTHAHTYAIPGSDENATAQTAACRSAQQTKQNENEKRMHCDKEYRINESSKCTGVKCLLLYLFEIALILNW